MKTIIVTGTPGTGKTTIAKKLAKKLGYYYLDVHRRISGHGLSEGYDKKRRTKIVDIKKLNKFLISKIKTIKKSNKNTKGIIIDSHLSHYLPRKYVDFCIVTKCDIKELNKRLKKRKYPKNKIQENIQAEIFNICHNEALERKHKMIVVDTTKSFNISSVVKRLGG